MYELRRRFDCLDFFYADIFLTITQLAIASETALKFAPIVLHAETANSRQCLTKQFVGYLCENFIGLGTLLLNAQSLALLRALNAANANRVSRLPKVAP